MKALPCRRNQIQIDIDAPHAARKRRKTYTALGMLTRETDFDYIGLHEERSKSGKGYHITITRAKKMSWTESNYYATILGDDWWRALFNHIRIYQGRRHPILFFKKGK
jgi:hypothetical protein